MTFLVRISWERLILCTEGWSFYLAVKPHRRWYRLGMGPAFFGGIHVSRSQAWA